MIWPITCVARLWSRSIDRMHSLFTHWIVSSTRWRRNRRKRTLLHSNSSGGRTPSAKSAGKRRNRKNKQRERERERESWVVLKIGSNRWMPWTSLDLPCVLFSSCLLACLFGGGGGSSDSHKIPDHPVVVSLPELVNESRSGKYFLSKLVQAKVQKVERPLKVVKTLDTIEQHVDSTYSSLFHLILESSQVNATAAEEEK